MKKIIIIGAGITGLSCAWKLSEKDYEVKVLESLDSIGGLAKSIKIDNYGCKNTFFQSLYIKVVKNTKLVSQKKIIDNVFNRQTRFFFPHISLYYGYKHKSIKKKIISNLPTLKKVIKIKNLCLSCREEKKLKWKKEKKLKWKIVETFRI